MLSQAVPEFEEGREIKSLLVLGREGMTGLRRERAEFWKWMDVENATPQTINSQMYPNVGQL